MTKVSCIIFEFNGRYHQDCNKHKPSPPALHGFKQIPLKLLINEIKTNTVFNNQVFIGW
jgi:hypothetical protein